MGATVILTGVSPGIAQTMVTVGIELDHRKELPVATPPHRCWVRSAAHHHPPNAVHR
jgi:hypothetical protein